MRVITRTERVESTRRFIIRRRAAPRPIALGLSGHIPHGGA